MIFTAPKTLEELKEAVANRSQRFVFAAGCTDILPKKLGKPWEVEEIIDLTHVPELKEIRFQNMVPAAEAEPVEAAGDLFIGACCTHAQIAENLYIRKHYTALAQACAQVGSVQIRNRGTIGGNVSNGSPSADTLPCLMALGAEIEWIDGVCIKGFWLPAVPLAGSGTALSAFAKLGDRDIVTIARIDLAVKTVLRGGRFTNTAVVIGAASQQPFFCDEAAAVLDGSSPQETDREAFAEALSKAIEASIPDRPTMPYKRRAVYGPAFDLLDRLTNI